MDKKYNNFSAIYIYTKFFNIVIYFSINVKVYNRIYN